MFELFREQEGPREQSWFGRDTDGHTAEPWAGKIPLIASQADS
jgi:hypothetical protein